MDLLYQCLQFSGWVQLGITLLIILFFGAIFWGLFFVFCTLFPKKGILRKLLIFLKWPTFVFFLEVGAVVGLEGMGYRQLPLVQQILIILFVATIGWGLVRLMRALYEAAAAKYDTTELSEIDKRSAMTQVQLLYRIIIFFIVILTIGAILLTFPSIKNLGVGILGSAGILGIALGIAARPILLNLMAGFQIAFTKMLKIGDAVIIQDNFSRIEKINLTHVIAKTWDLRRIVVPISYFIDNPFQNWSARSTELIGTVFLYCDYTVPVGVVREKFHEILQSTDLWNGRVWKVQVTEFTEQTMQIRLIMSADEAPIAFELRCLVREQLMSFLQKEYPHALPQVRYNNLPV